MILFVGFQCDNISMRCMKEEKCEYGGACHALPINRPRDTSASPPRHDSPSLCMTRALPTEKTPPGPGVGPPFSTLSCRPIKRHGVSWLYTYIYIYIHAYILLKSSHIFSFLCFLPSSQRRNPEIRNLQSLSSSLEGKTSTISLSFPKFNSI